MSRPGGPSTRSTITDPTHLRSTSGGHNAGIVSGPRHDSRRLRVGRPRAAHTRFSRTRRMARPRSEVAQGSWWPRWLAWLEARSGDDARAAAASGYAAQATPSWTTRRAATCCNADRSYARRRSRHARGRAFAPACRRRRSSLQSMRPDRIAPACAPTSRPRSEASLTRAHARDPVARSAVRNRPRKRTLVALATAAISLRSSAFANTASTIAECPAAKNAARLRRRGRNRSSRYLGL